MSFDPLALALHRKEVGKLQEKTVTENGEVTPDTGYAGMSKVVVAVPETPGDGIVNVTIEEV